MGCQGSSPIGGQKARNRAERDREGQEEDEETASDTDEDGETFAEMRSIVAASCTLAVRTAEWTLQGRWSSLDEALRDNAARNYLSLADICEAARVRNVSTLKIALTAPQANNNSATGPEAVTVAAAVAPARLVVVANDLLRLRRAILAAALEENGTTLRELVTHAERLGERCGVESDFAAELLEKDGSKRPAGVASIHHSSAAARAPPTSPPVSSPQKGEPRSPGAVPPLTPPATTASPSFEMPADGGGSGASIAPAAAARGDVDWRLKALGLEDSASLPSQQELRAAYRRAALRWHPDRPHNAGVEEATENFRLAREAYESLRAVEGCSERSGQAAKYQAAV
eukprot:TRINITY_DN74257_c0_g1_i1.p1 TRINITY_DN74257_c0_g1~~TRINITY_DN74257_c0_g1_i1.p1  ORF type:complete len:344 (-),score=76.01 TRINITY_DN74257_c0_g1_i1:69-1100(-)